MRSISGWQKSGLIVDCDNVLLTLAAPDRFDDVMLHAEYHRGDDDGRQGGLGDEGRVGHEEGEAEEDKEASVEAAHGCPHSTGSVHCRPTEGAGDGHGLDKTTRQVTETQG